jgi:hypothetical protein
MPPWPRKSAGTFSQRISSCSMGSGVGAIASTAIFTLAGWAGAARLGAAFGGTGVRFWLAFQRIDRARERSLGENVAAFSAGVATAKYRPCGSAIDRKRTWAERRWRVRTHSCIARSRRGYRKSTSARRIRSDRDRSCRRRSRAEPRSGGPRSRLNALERRCR